MRTTAALITCIVAIIAAITVAITAACSDSNNANFAAPPLLDRYVLSNSDSVPEGVAFDPQERSFYATSLQGGVLLQTPLKGADGSIYAVAQGAVSIGGFSAGTGGGNSVQKNHLEVGRVPNGVLVEREVPTALEGKGGVEIALNNPDFSTASRLARARSGAKRPMVFVG